MTLLADPFVVYPSSLGLALLLLLAAAHKLRNPAAFGAVLASYGLARAIPILQKLIPLIELLPVCALLWPATRAAAAIGAALLFLLYGAAMAHTLYQGKLIADCGCSFGQIKTPVSRALIWRNLALAVIAINLCQGIGQRPLGVADYLAIVMLTKIGAVFYLLVNALITTQLSSQDLFHD